MGLAMAKGWLRAGLDPALLQVVEPHPSEELQTLVSGILPSASAYEGPAPAVTILAIKPQMMADVLPEAGALFSPDTMVLSVAAGTTIERLQNLVGECPVVRAMPNTPAAIGAGISAIIGNDLATESHLSLAEGLLGAVGQVLRLENEGQMDAVTALSGSGPAYVFYLTECMAAAGMRLGLPEETAHALARATVAGSGALLDQSGEDAGALRQAVTSPGGTTAAALDVLMAEPGLRELMALAMDAAAARSKALAEG